MNIRCRLGFHDYDYFTMTRLDGGIEHHRCCLRCEKSQYLGWEAAKSFATDADVALVNSDATKANTPQEQGHANLMALFGVKVDGKLDQR